MTRVLSAICVTVLAVQPLEVLDLTVPSRSAAGPQELRSVQSFIFSLSPHAPPQTWPVRLTIKSFDKPAYRPEERFVVEVELEALDAVVIPWSADIEAPDPTGTHVAPDLKVMFVSLRSMTSKSQLIDTRGMAAGSGLVPGSLKQLAAGDRVLIKLSGFWTCFTGDCDEPLPARGTIKAELGMCEGKYYKGTISSQNAMPVSTISQ